MLVGFDATTIRRNKTGVGYYTARLLERMTRVNGERNPVDELIVLSNLAVPLAGELPRTTEYEQGRLGVRAVWMQAVLPFILERLRPDVCHFTNFLAPVATSAPYVVTFHDMSLQLMPEYHTLKKRWMTASLMPEVARRARLIITPSESARRDVSRVLGTPPEKIRVIPHAADPLFRPVTDEASFARVGERYGLRRPYLLYVGTLEPRKNVARALAAFASLRTRYPEHSFYLVGDLGWQYQEVLDSVERLGLQDRVKRLGYVDEHDLPTLYSYAELFVYPSLYEGFGFPVLEAMACGAPVLTSNSSSLAEIGRGAALLVDPRRVEAIASAMDRGLTHGPERDAWIRRGRQRAASYSWEKTTSATLAVYEEAAERRALRDRGGAPVSMSRARAILETVAYGSVFDFPMKREEIHRALMGIALEPDEIDSLLRSHPSLRARVERRGPYYCLRGRGRQIPERWSRERATRQLIARHAEFLALVRRCPFVRMVALSGAAAHGNATDEDIDLFIVTAPGHAWAVALALFLAAKLAGVRRTMCMNYLLSERAMGLEERDPFTANQIVGLKLLGGRECYLRFVRANAWGSRFYPNFWKHYRHWLPSAPPAGTLWVEIVLRVGIDRLLEGVGRLVLGTYLRWRHRRAGRPAAVKLEPERIKLHFRDHGQPLTERIESVLEEIETGGRVVAGR